MISINLCAPALVLAASGGAAADPGGAGFFSEWANVEDPWEYWLLAFGLIAQTTFFARWILQWVASERRGESHMPQLFWWLSLSGATMLFAYFSLRGEPIGMLGQSVGWVVYARNLHLIRRRHEGTEARRREGEM